MRRRVRTHKFNRVKYAIDVEGAKGLCTPKRLEMPEIFIARPEITMKESLPYGETKHARLMLITLLHECLHASDWKMSEKRVDCIANDVGGLLWRLGYRRVRGRR